MGLKLRLNPFKYADALGILRPGGQLSKEMSAKNDGWLTEFHNKKAPLIVGSIFGGMAAGGAFGGGSAAGSGGLAGLGGTGAAATTGGTTAGTTAASSTPAWLKYARLAQMASSMGGGAGGGGAQQYGQPPQHQFVGPENPYAAMVRRIYG